MVDTSSLAGVMAASRRPVPRRVDTSTLAGVRQASQPSAPVAPRPVAPRPAALRPTPPPAPKPQADQAARRTAGVRRPATQEQPSFLDRMGENFLRGRQAEIDRQAEVGRGVTSFLNPAPSLTSAIAEGRAPRASDVALDAGLFAAGMIPFAGPGIRAGGQAARTGLSTAARANSINRYLNKPAEYYSENLNAPVMRNFFEETVERIPSGAELYRAPAYDEVLPTEIGAVWQPGRVISTGGPQDLQILGEVLSGVRQTGGRQDLNPRMLQITAMDELPGIRNVNEYLSRMNVPNRFVSDFAEEGLLGPATQYILRNYIPGQGSQPPTWYFNAFNR